MTSELSHQEISNLITSERPVVLDIGCHDGRDGIGICKLLNNPELHAFECDERNIRLFKDQHHPGWSELWPVAISDRDGFAVFNMSEGRNNASGSIRNPAAHFHIFPDVKFNTVDTVECMKLDTWYNNVLHPRIIDFTWADVNGAEGKLIAGGIETLTYYTKYLYIEFSDKELYAGQPTKAELIAMLPGYEVIGEYNFKGNFGNLLMKNKNL